MASGIRGITVKIGGDTTKLGKALEEVNGKSKNLSSELGQINKLLKLDPGNTELLAQKQKVLAEAVETTRNKLNTLKTAEAQVQEQFKKGEVSEEQVRALQREIITTTKKLDSYENAARETSDQIDKLGDESKESAGEVDKLGDEAKETGKELDDAGDKANNFGDKLKTVGQIGATALGAIATASAAAVTALGNATVEAAAYADEILTASIVTGISTDKLQEYQYASELVDVSVETLTKSMAKNIKSMKGVQDGTKLSIEAYKKLGVEVTNADGSLRDGETVYWEVIDALGKMENETERDALGMQILGKSAQELNPLIEAGSERMNELAQEAREVGAVLSGESLDALGAFDDSIQRLKGSTGAAKNALGSVLLPELQLLTDTGGELLNEFNQTLNASGGGLEGLASTIESMSGKLAETASNIVNRLILTIETVAPTISTVAINLMATLASTLISNIPQLVGVATEITNSLLTGLSQALPQIATAISTAIPQLVAVLQSALPQLISGLVQVVTALVGAIDQILPPLIASIPVITTALVEALVQNLPLLLDGIIQLIYALTENIVPITEAIIMIIPPVLVALCSAIGAMLPTLLTAIIELTTKLTFEVLPQLTLIITAASLLLVPAILVGLGKILYEVGKWFVDFVVKIGEWLRNVISTVQEWLPEFVTQAKEAGSKFIDGVAEFLKNLPEKAGYFLGMVIGKTASFVVNMTNNAREAGAKFIDNVINFVKGLPSKIWTWLSNVIPKIIEWRSQLAAKGAEAAKNLVTKIIDGVKNLPTKIKTVGKDIVTGLWNGINDKLGWIKTQISGFASNVLKGFTDFFKIQSPSVVMRDEVGKQLATGLAIGIKKNAKTAVSAVEETATQILNAAKKKLDNHKVYKELTLAEEVAFWDEVRKQCKEGTDARVEADKNYYTAKKTVTDNLVKLEQDYVNDVENVQKKLIDNIQAVTDEYDKAVASRQNQILSTMKLFDAFTQKETISKNELFSNLNGQISALWKWDQTLEQLANREGMDAGLLEYLEGLGPEYLGTLQQISSMTDEELSEYVYLFRRKNQLAKERAIKENADLLASSQEQIKILMINAEADLDALDKTYVDGLKDIGVNTEKASRGIGENIVDGLKSGIISQQAELQTFLTTFFSDLVLTAKGALDINSPSRVFADVIGKQIPAGIALGIKNNGGVVTGAISRMMSGTITQADSLNGATLNRKLTATFATTGSAEALNGGTLLSKLDGIYERLGRLQVVLNNGALVGGIIDDIDSALADKQLLSSRGV